MRASACILIGQMGCSPSCNEISRALGTDPPIATIRVADFPEAPTVALQSPVDEPPASRSVHSTYRLQEKLGKCAFASVYSVRNAFVDERYAVKVMDLRPKGSGDNYDRAPCRKRLEVAEREFAIAMAAPLIPNIVRSVAHFTEGCIGYLVMEQCDQTILSTLERLPKLNEQVYKRIFKEMLTGLAALHSARIVHRDVKPDNFMCCGPGATIKLCDFGLAESVSTQDAKELTGISGTPPFMAPEMLAMERYGERVDVWAFGVVIYSLFFGRFPYNGTTQTGPAMKAAILAGVPPPSFQPSTSLCSVSNSALALTREMLVRKPSGRLRAAAAMRSEFFVQETGSPISLRPSLHAAKRAGLFETRCARFEKASSLDAHLVSLQAAHAAAPATLSPARDHEEQSQVFSKPGKACKVSKREASDASTTADSEETY